jgi:2-dehydropantoate 2-reductase
LFIVRMYTFTMKILVFGAGSIGVFLGTKLHAVGNTVTLHGGRKLQKVHDTILVDNELFAMPPRISKLENNTHYNYVFIATKLYDVKNAIREIEQAGIHSEQFVFIQNGLVEKGFYDDMGEINLATISVFEGYRLIENQLLTTGSSSGWQTDDSAAGQAIARLLNAAGITCTSSSNLDSLRAEKMLLVNAVSALSAIERKTIGELIDSPETKKIVDDVFKESHRVLQERLTLPSYAESYQRFWKTVTSLGKHYTSMYQDVISGRKTEINFLNGLIVKMGAEQGIPTPANEKLYAQIKLLSD